MPDQPSSNTPGATDEESPYEDEDLSTYPEWWRQNIELFERHQLRPYRPPRFSDGTITTEVVSALEDELGVIIQLRAVGPDDYEQWEIIVDGKPTSKVRHSREEQGNSRYHITAEEFEERVRQVVQEMS